MSNQHMASESRPMAPSNKIAEARAFDSVMRIFGRYHVDPRRAHADTIAAVMKRMTAAEVECVATAQRMVMRLNGVQPKWELN